VKELEEKICKIEKDHIKAISDLTAKKNKEIEELRS